MTPKIIEEKQPFDAQILVVDDTPANLRLLGDIFRERGYNIRQARDGKLAIQSALVEPPDLILLDIVMPEIDGYEVCSQLKANPKTQNVPVIFMSAKGEVFDKVKAFSVGGVDYITKPFAAEEVVVRIENQLRVWQRSKEVLEQNNLLQEELQELQRLEMELKNRGDLSRLRVNLVPQGPSGDRTASSILKPVLSETSVLETECLVLTPETTLEDSITRMSQMRASCALVAKKEKLAGILTERDIVKITAENLELENIKVSQVMTADPIAITLSAELDLFSILSLMRQHRIRHLPAVDRAGTILGVITQSSIRKVLQPMDLLKLKRVREVMIPKVVRGDPGSSLLEITTMMATESISCVVITQKSENGSDVLPIGIVTERDIVQFRALGVDFLSTLAGEVTIAPLLSVGVEDSLWEAHKLMESHRIRRLVVVSDGGSLAGTIAQSSLLEALDPVDIYSTLETLRLQVDKRIVRLNQANDRLQQEIALREKALSQREVLERQLTEQNTRLQEEVRNRILAEKNLSKREGELRALVENAPDAILRLDRQLRYLYVNAKFTRDVGKSSAEILGKSIRELSTTKHLTSPWEEAVGEVFNTGEEREVEFETASTAGIKHYSARVVPEWGDNGEVETLLGVVRDVSDRKRAEEETQRLLEASQAINDAADVESALAAILGLICRAIDWDWGEAWTPSRDGTVLEPSKARYRRDSSLTQFQQSSEKITFAPGEGLPGRILQGKQPEWLEEIDRVSEGVFFRKKLAAEAGLKTALGVPVVADGRVVAVLVFFKNACLPKHQQSMELVGAIASQLARTIESKQAQQAIRLGEERLQLAIEGSELGIWDLRLDTLETYFSLQWKRMLGYEEEEIENSYGGWERLIHPEDLGRAEKALNACLRGETQTYQAEFRMRSRSGEWLWIFSQGKIVEWNSEGQPLRMAGTHKDISDRKLAEIERERLLESERAAREEAEAARTRATDILESIGDAFFALDKDWKFTYVNRQAEFLLHRKRSELMGRTVWEEFPEAVGSNFERQYRRVASQQVKSEFVEFYPPLDVWFEVRAFPAKEGISVYFQDVSDRVAAETALRNSEHFLRSIYEGAETSIFIVDVGENGEFRYVGINPAHERISGLQDSQLKGKTPEEALPAAVAKKVSDRYRACTEARERISYEECLPFKGKDTWWITNLTPLFDSSDRVYRLIGTCFNITDRKKAEIATARQMRRDRLVGTIQERIRSSLNLEEILTTAAEETRKFLKSDRVLIYQVLPGQVKVAIVESVEPDVTPICDIIPEEVFPQETYELYRQGEVFVMEDIDKTAVSRRLTPFLRQSGIKAKLGIPILKDGELWGLLAVHQCRRARPWQAGEIESLKQIAVQLAIGIQQSTLYQQAQAEIWERQAAETALRESKRFVQNIADTSPNLLYIFDLEEQRNIYSNREISGAIGYSSQEIKDMGDRILPTIIHPEDLAKLPSHHQKWAAAKDGDILELEYRMKNSKEEWCYILARETVFARTKEGKAKQILGTASDITTLKQTERALREAADREKTLALAFQRMRQSLDIDTIFSATTEELRQALGCERVAIYRFDADYSGEYVAESFAAEELAVAAFKDAGRSLRSGPRQDCRLDTLLGSPQKWHDSYLKETQGSHLKSADPYCLVVKDIYEANFSGCYLERLEEFQIRAYIIVPIFCGSKLWGLLAAYECSRPRQWKTSEEKIATEIGNQLGVALQQAELLEQTKKQSEALERAAIAADGANRAKSEFLASMSHELRTPLNAILGFTQLMNRDRSLATQHQQQLKIIDGAGEHLLALINDILEMSKIEAGRTTLNPTRFNLTAMLESLESMLRLKAQSKGLQLIFDIPPDIPRVIEADEGKLRQVLINILGNAIKFTKSGGANLRVKAETSNLPDVQLLFEIEDTGPGIAPEEMHRLFEPFAQTKTGRQSQQGTGLGLPISRKFVQLMGGDIRASSIFAQGTVFAFDIPVAVADTADLVGEPSEGRAIALREGTEKRRILVVDDQDHNRQFLVALLTAIGFEVREAGNGRQALSLWSSWEPHLILMDMRMPVMDGYEATKGIKATPKGQTTTVIALTASAFEEDRQKILAAGCDDLVCKPFREEVLLEKIGDRLGIEYIYESDDGQSLESSQTPGKTVTTSDIIQYLSQMPQDWVAEVGDAASQGTDDVILELLDRVPDSLSPLASALGDLANNFQFEAIMELTQQKQK
ncbi:MAG: PAS domain S-box protein [Cyanobacteriota bacterium]|nr:PAS domain S-box protein [Cyanobacteriota bacterium]